MKCSLARKIFEQPEIEDTTTTAKAFVHISNCEECRIWLEKEKREFLEKVNITLDEYLRLIMESMNSLLEKEKLLKQLGA